MVTRTRLEPDYAVIDYYQPNHMNEAGDICHGPESHNLLDMRHELPPHLSKEARNFVTELITHQPDISTSHVVTSKS